MKNKIILSIILLCFTNSLFTQNKEKNTIESSNKITYFDFFLGRIKDEPGSKNLSLSEKLSVGFSLNYQHNKNLFSLRHTKTFTGDIFYFVVPFAIDEDKTYKETGILYGLRFNESKGFSQSVSVGISYNKNISENFVGIPFEFNIKNFKKEKRKRTIFGISPVGKPTGIGRSLGLKIYGNISKESYIGLALSYSYGYHKKY